MLKLEDPQEEGSEPTLENLGAAYFMAMILGRHDPEDDEEND